MFYLVAHRGLYLCTRQADFRKIHRILVAFLEVAVYESLCLYDNRIDKAVFFGFGDGLVQFGHFSQLFGGVILFGSLTLQNAQVVISKAHPVEVER